MASTFVGAPAALRARVAPRRGSRDARALTRADASAQAVPAVTPSTVGSRCGSASVKGTVRKQNEDRFASYTNPNAKDGSPYAIYGVYDGHGGFAVSQWLTDNLANFICEEWPKADFCLEALSQACLRADFDLIQPPPGFFGAFGERGVGGAKCGSTAVTALLFEQGGKPCLATANVGDARILLVRDGKAVQLSVDHVPDDEAERKRIDRGNPNLRKSLVTFTEGSWRVGGVLALSRAFGDAFLKESGRFEGLGERNADYGSGFGLNAEPDCAIEQLSDLDSWVMLSSDGLFANDERGGGGGFENQEIADFLLAAPADASPESLAKELCSMAVSKGSTDDVTVTLMRL